MQRDMDLIRKVVLAAECGPPYSGIEGYTESAIKYHQMLAIEGGLLKGKHLKDFSNVTDVPSAVLVQGVTWEGHDFIDSIRDEDRWTKVKSFLMDAGKQLTVETVKFAAKQLFGVA